MNTDPSAITRLLAQCKEGDRGALDALIPHVYEQLHGMAEKCFRGERESHTLRATALVHEAYLRLAGAEVDWQSRAHFFAVAARVMRRILVDHARGQQRQKRGGGAWKLSLDDTPTVGAEKPAMMVALDDALTGLAGLDARKSETLEMIYFGGLTYEEAAAVLGVSVPTVQRDLRMAKAWIYREMQKDRPEPPAGEG
ncbi:MAG: sigma-70 family RNA polymerase sigma factor [Acidobacteria bacterium]|nr:sigma-70 family RNA polymerase sigma factor [Acidobacteriota bacterium]